MTQIELTFALFLAWPHPSIGIRLKPWWLRRIYPGREAGAIAGSAGEETMEKLHGSALPALPGTTLSLALAAGL